MQFGEHKKGRPRSVDSILMAIKGICLEAIHKNYVSDPNMKQVLHRILATYNHGSRLVAPIYIEKAKEIDAIIRKVENERGNLQED